MGLANSDADSVASILAAQNPDLAQISAREMDTGLVNRLDYETSGIIIYAKDRKSWEAFRALFSKKASIVKEYCALVEGFAPAQMSCDGYIGSAYRRAGKVRVQKHKAPRFLRASTEFTLLKKFQDYGVSALKASTNSGRRHQVRAHAAHLGFPLLGDALYGAGKHTSAIDPAFPKFCLHAWKYHFSHPLSGENLTIEAPLKDLSWGYLLEDLSL